MNLKLDRYYMHKDCKDVCIYIEDYDEYNAPKNVFTVEWWNLGYTGAPWPISSQEKMTVLDQDIPNWIDVTEIMFNKRNESGLPK